MPETNKTGAQHLSQSAACLPTVPGKHFSYPTELIEEFALNPRPVNPGEAQLRSDIKINGQTDALRVAPHPDKDLASKGWLMVVGGGNTRLRVLRDLKIKTAICILWKFDSYLDAVSEHVSENRMHSPLTLSDKVRAIGLMKQSLSDLDGKTAVKRILSTLEQQHGNDFASKKSSVYNYLHAYFMLRHWHCFSALSRRHISVSQVCYNNMINILRGFFGNNLPGKDNQFWEQFVFAPAAQEALENNSPDLSVYLKSVCYAAGRAFSGNSEIKQQGVSPHSLGYAISLWCRLEQLPDGLTLPAKPQELLRMADHILSDTLHNNVANEGARNNPPPELSLFNVSAINNEAKKIVQAKAPVSLNVELTAVQAAQVYKVLMKLPGIDMELIRKSFLPEK